jgi:hypothetical protein
MSFVIREKLKFIKGAIKVWNVKKFGEIMRDKDRLIKGIMDLDLKSESMGLDVREVEARKKNV